MIDLASHSHALPPVRLARPAGLAPTLANLPSGGRERGTLALRPDERLDLGIGLRLPPAAMEDAIMADFELEVVGLFCRRDARAQIMRGNGLAGAADIVALALDRHQRGALDRRRDDQVAANPKPALRAGRGGETPAQSSADRNPQADP